MATEAQTGNLAPIEDKNAYDGSITWGICFRCDRLRISGDIPVSFACRIGSSAVSFFTEND